MGIRIIKTAIATVIAIYIATYFQLSFPLSAGLLAILGVDVTRRRSLLNVLHRILASVLGLLLASFLFYIVGFYIWVIGVYILLAYPILSKMKLKDGIVTSSVIVFHVFSVQTIHFDVILNEIWLLLIGLGSATLINFLYMPKVELNMKTIRNQVEDLLSEIFNQMSYHLKDSSTIWQGKEIIEVEKKINEGLELAKRFSENNLFRQENEWLNYFHMRSRQMESIHKMVNLVAQVYESIPQGKMTAAVFDELVKEVKEEFYTGRVLDDLKRVETLFKEMELPKTRKEFEVRSAILQLCLELKDYLNIAKKEKKKFLSL
ncbi:aromatic acid exporter family protein [Chengkuizengella sp. 2205SS18-9]|uniref:Aromatic acid exporter family protein n=1 Tax=Chengkuizengella axinellae TaxID=3064388 RepID=A0ABT9IX65_9BACL|nr:aromatic acid exporter family protein [Chengkuizengella sp. 2205SS18-9]MDP5273964.1 aromatic acid exporter family protein [Chengkuizengella sp. 2205SS18-9]